MKNIIIKTLLLCSVALLFTGCASSYHTIIQMEPSLQYVRSAQDGSITVKVSATGKNYADAIAEAKKYALRTVLFHGVNVPSNALLSKPIITEVNSEEEHQKIYDNFFKKKYKNYVISEGRGTDRVAKSKTSTRVQTIVCIKRSNLKEFCYRKKLIKTK